MISQSSQSVVLVLFFMVTTSLATEYADTPGKDIDDNADTLLHKLRSQRIHGSSLLLNGVGDGLLKQDATMFLKHLEDGLLYKQEVQLQHNTRICRCHKLSCRCCVHLKWKKVHLNDMVCANFTYLPAPDYAISVIVSLDGIVIVHTTVSVRNAPPICAGIPYLEKIASLCLRFYDISFTNRTLSACMDLEAVLMKVNVENFKLGCYKLQPSKELEDVGTHGLHVLKPVGSVGDELAGPKELKDVGTYGLHVLKPVGSVGVELAGPKEPKDVGTNGPHVLKPVGSVGVELSGQKELKDVGTNGLHVLKHVGSVGVELAEQNKLKDVGTYGLHVLKPVGSVGVELAGPKELMHVLSKGLKSVASKPAELTGQKEDNYDPDNLYFKSMKEVFGNNY